MKVFKVVDFRFGFLVKSCMFCQMAVCRIPKVGRTNMNAPVKVTRRKV